MKASELISNLTVLSALIGYDPEVEIYGAYASEGDIEDVIIEHVKVLDPTTSIDDPKFKYIDKCVIGICSDISSG